MDSLNLDFGSYGAGNYLVAADRSSGYVFCSRTQDQSTSTAVAFVKKLAFAYGWPAEIRSDNGPAFRLGFKEEMEALGIFAETSGAYNPGGNGAAERSIKEVKTYLSTNGALRGVELDAMLLRMNSTPSDTKGAGSAFERFFGRHARSDIPTAPKLITEVQSRQMIIECEEAQNRRAAKNSRANRDIFKINDPVRIKSNSSGLWDTKGTVLECILGEDGVARSFIIQTEDGRKLYRHSTYLHHLFVSEPGSPE